MSFPALACLAIARPVRGEFTYLVPAELENRLSPGQRVLVPFGRGSALGFYLGPGQAPSGAGVVLKAIARALEKRPALPEDLVRLLRFVAAYYRYPLGEAIRAALPPGLGQADEERAVPPESQLWAQAEAAADPSALPRSRTQAACLSYLLAVGGRASVDEVGHAIPGAKQALAKLSQRGWVRLVEMPVSSAIREGLAHARPERLTSEQQVAISALCAAVDRGGFAPFLLHGVTGSGKTEVYLRLVEHALARGRGALVLVPEIALTPQLVGRFRSRFGNSVAVLHSALKDRERLRDWQSLRRGDVKIAVGVRSAVFAPVADLGVVVVDEEHDPSFKQEEKLRYQARDVAVVRAKQAGAVIVLGSATPSLETLENARRGRYRSLLLNHRVEDRPLPTVEVVDLRLTRPRSSGEKEEPPVLSPALLSAIEGVLAKGQQVILFLNRRGHSTFLVCEVCGESLRCRSCDVALTQHLSLRKVICHYCGEFRAMPPSCPSCGGAMLKLGAGTERVEAEVAARFAHARVARLDRDAASSSKRLTELLSAFARREVDVLVGTQMVAKGHDFPGVTLVCAVMADASLALPDFRAAERTFQLLTQVAGRAGRGSDPGRVLLQTYHPEAESVSRAAAHDYAGFASGELARRQALAYPPFTRLVAIRVEGNSPSRTQEVACELGHQISGGLPPPAVGVRLLGPAPAPIARIKGKTRWQLLLKGPTHASLERPLARLERFLPEVPASVKVVIDVDPAAML